MIEPYLSRNVDRPFILLDCMPEVATILVLDSDRGHGHRYQIRGQGVYFSSLAEVAQYDEVEKYIPLTPSTGWLLHHNWARELWTHNEDIQLPPYWRKTGSNGSCTVYHNYYTRHLEEQYMYQMKKITQEPLQRCRNGETHSLFQWSWETDLMDGLPLFSTRRSFWKGICKELLFFIAGNTDSKLLEKDKIRIWEGNTSRQFLDSRGLNYKEGDMGPMYGWNWRHFGATYSGADTDYTGKGFDQLRDVVDKIINDPTNRRILLTTYDPSKVSESVLAPCHGIVSQFNVNVDAGRLDMFTYQRSADMFLGVNFNIPSHATLLYIISAATGLRPGRMYYGFGDNHVYSVHKEALETLLRRTPNDTFPQLEITRPLPERRSTESALEWITNLQFEDFEVKGYFPQESIKAEMVV
jgi:thymidylate synthase